MQNNLIGMLGMPLDEIAQSAFIRSLTDNPNVEQIHDSLHMTLPASGVEFTAEIDGGVSAIHIHAEAFQGYRGFQGDLPEGIKFSDSRKTIQDKLGKPSASDTGAVVAFFGKALQWDRFDRADHILHIQYADDGAAVNLVTLMPREQNQRGRDVSGLGKRGRQISAGGGDNAVTQGERLVPLFIPPLAAVLLRCENQKGTPLLQDEVISIRNSAVCMMVPESSVANVTESRGYQDINPENCWEEWQSRRQKPAGEGT